jgi:hypothetical protein
VKQDAAAPTEVGAALLVTTFEVSPF